MKIHLIENF